VDFLEYPGFQEFLDFPAGLDLAERMEQMEHPDFQGSVVLVVTLDIPEFQGSAV